MKNVWKCMIQRCHNPRNPSFARYGGRGITVCDRWRTSFADFVADVGERPSAAHTLDRIDNDRGYEPQNVRWATRREQAANRSTARPISHAGRTLSVSEWAREAGLGANTLGRRLDHGWSMGEALSAPPDQRFHPARTRIGLENVHRKYTNKIASDTLCTPVLRGADE